MNRALVIGASGFVGLAVVDALLAAGVQVRATRRRRSFTVLLRRRPVELVEADLHDPPALRRAMDGCEAVFMVAGHYPRYSLDPEGEVARGVRTVRHVCDAALEAGGARLIFTSSTGSLAPAPAGRAADERDVPAQIPTDSVYRAVKWALEDEVAAARRRGLDAVTLLPGGCVGPHDVRVGTQAFLVGVARGEMPWWVDGLVHLVDVDEVARAHVQAARLDSPAPRYCLPGQPWRAGELLRFVAGRYGGRVPPERLTPVEARARADREEREAAPRRARVPLPRALVDLITTGQPIASTSAERDLGFVPEPIDGALDRAHAWFARNGYLRAAPAAATEGA